MRKRRVYAVVIGVAVVVGLMVWVFSREREPEYGGKRLSEWVRELPQNGPLDGTTQAEEAIHHIGTNALPYLLKWIRWNPSRLRIKLQPRADQFLTKLNPKLLKLTQNHYALQFAAVRAFEALGPEAVGAIGELNRLMTNPEKSRGGDYASIGLASCGREAFLVLMTALTNRHAEVRGRAALRMSDLGTNSGPAVPLLIERLKDEDQTVVWGTTQALRRFKSDPRVLPALTNCVGDASQKYRAYAIRVIGEFDQSALPAVPLLVECLKDQDREIVQTAEIALGGLRLEPNLVVPALALNLQHPYFAVRYCAAIGLGLFGEKAGPAVPALVKALNDADSTVRQEATNTIRKIDPQALERAGR